jgi:hypothetical protein
VIERADASQGGSAEPSMGGTGTSWVPSRTLARLGSTPTNRRAAAGRVIFALVLLAISVPLLTLAAQRANRTLTAWLHGRKTYQLPFEDIELVPAPPAWIQSGKRGLLDRVREHANWPASISVLDTDLDALAADFQRASPWIRGVERKETAYPNRLRLVVRYREPVARVTVQRLGLVLDRDGVVLPDDDLDRDAAGSLVEIINLLPVDAAASTIEARPGRSLKLPASGEDDIALRASRLAEFFKSHATLKRSTKPVCRIVAIHEDKRGLFAQTAESAMILWGPAPGFEQPGEPTAEEKWGMLEDWLEAHNDFKAVQHPRFLAFEKGRVILGGKP